MLPLESSAGTRDFLPTAMMQRNWLHRIWREVSQSHGFQEYDAPVVEHKTWFTTKRGSDDVLKEMYLLQDTSLVLRPEMTPSLCRLILQSWKPGMLPLCWFSLPQCWRMETPNSQRKREHFQWNVDIVGIPKETLRGEIELFSLLIHFFQNLGLTSKDVEIRYSDRAMVYGFIQKLGVSSPDNIMRVIDKRNKLTGSEWEKLLRSHELTDESIHKLNEFLAGEHTMIPFNQWLRSTNLGKEMSPWFTLDLSIVRGLDYYTGLVFEIFAKPYVPGSRAICGGGRYDNLLERFDSKKSTPMLGFGMGDVLIYDLLKEKKLLPSEISGVPYLVVAFKDDLFEHAATLANKMRLAGKVTQLYLKKHKKLADVFAYADKHHVEKLVLVAPEEWVAGKCKVVDLRVMNKTLREQTISIDALV